MFYSQKLIREANCANSQCKQTLKKEQEVITFKVFHKGLKLKIKYCNNCAVAEINKYRANILEITEQLKNILKETK